MKKLPFNNLLISYVTATLIVVMLSNTIVLADSTSTGQGDPFNSSSFIDSVDYEGRYCKYGFSKNRLSFTVLENNTKIRANPWSANNNIIRTLDAGTEVIVTGAAYNAHDNTWFALEDGGYIFSKRVAFNLKKNSTTEYLALKYEFDRNFPSASGTLIAMFSKEGGRYLENLLGLYGNKTEYIIQTKKECILVPASRFKYIYYGYIAGRVGFTEHELMLITSHGKSVEQLEETAAGIINDKVLEGAKELATICLSTSEFSSIAPWVSKGYDILSTYSSMNEHSTLADFRNHCVEELCYSVEEGNLIKLGYEFGISDRNQ